MYILPQETISKYLIKGFLIKYLAWFHFQEFPRNSEQRKCLSSPWNQFICLVWIHLSLTPLRIIWGLVKDSEVTGGMPPSGGINVVLTEPWLCPLKAGCHKKKKKAGLASCLPCGFCMYLCYCDNICHDILTWCHHRDTKYWASRLQNWDQS